MSDDDVKRIAQLQMEALQFSFTDKIGTVVQKGIEAAHALVKNEAIDELELAKASLHSQMEFVIRWDKNRDDLLRKQIYALCESLEIILRAKINCESPQDARNPDEVLSEEEIDNEIKEANDTAESTLDYVEPPDHDNKQLTQPLPTGGCDVTHNAIVEFVDEQPQMYPKLEDADHYFDDLEMPLDGPVKHEMYADLLDIFQPSNEDNLMKEIEESGAKLEEVMESGDGSALLHREESVEETVEERSDELMENNEDENNDLEDAEDDSYQPDENIEVDSTPKTRKSIANNKGKYSEAATKPKGNCSKFKKRACRNSTGKKTTRANKCGECGNVYRSRSFLNIHMRIKHSENEEIRRPFKCEECGKRSSTSWDHKLHMATHSNNLMVRKPFKCKNCGKRFAQKAHLTTHIKTHQRK